MIGIYVLIKTASPADSLTDVLTKSNDTDMEVETVDSLFSSDLADSEFWKDLNRRWHRSVGKSSSSKYVFKKSRKPSSSMH